MDELSACEARGNLHHKIALFYADGNGFGSILRQCLANTKPEKAESMVREFDHFLQERRRRFLSKLLERTSEKRWLTSEGMRRIEVLLWGGDEMMLVLPAWCGWETAALFSECMKDAVFQRSRPLKHAMGLVFAHHKAPIHALRELVTALAEEAKVHSRERDLLSYLVLESFDHIGEDLSRFRELRGRQPATLAAEGGSLHAIATALKSLKTAEFPRRKVFQAAMGLARGKTWPELAPDIDPYVRPWDKELSSWKNLTKNLKGDDTVSWLHLADLWDYAEVE
jgi:hypothetical protein